MWKGSGRQHDVQHNDECRDRVRKLFMDEGAQRVESYFERARVREETGSGGTATSSGSATVVTHAQTPKRKADDEAAEMDTQSKMRKFTESSTYFVKGPVCRSNVQKILAESSEYVGENNGFLHKQLENTNILGEKSMHRKFGGETG